MGAILGVGLAEDLLTTIGRMFGRVRGGLALAVVMVGTLLAAATGVVGASVTAMGVISMPVMLRHGYSKALASGVICASGTLGQIIPPSVVLVVLADQLGISVGDLFLGALPRVLMLAAGYALYVFVYAWFNPSVAPPVTIGPSNGLEKAPALVGSICSDATVNLDHHCAWKHLLQESPHPLRQGRLVRSVPWFWRSSIADFQGRCVLMRWMKPSN